MFTDLLIRLRSLFRRNVAERELSDELQFHLENEIEKRVRSGMTREEAVRRARIDLGGFAQIMQQCREVRGTTFLEDLVHDLRYGLRMLRKSRVFTLVTVITLALGIGATAAIFTLVNALLLQTLPVSHPQQLVLLHWSAHKGPEGIGTSSFGDCQHSQLGEGPMTAGCSLSYPFFEQVRNQTGLFTSAIAFAGPSTLDLAGNGPARIVAGELVSGNYFETLGVQPALGRMLNFADEQSAAAVTVLDYSYWQTAFQASPAVIGKTIRLNNAVFTIIGVVNPGFTHLTPGKSANLYIPLTAGVALSLPWADPKSEADWWLSVVARLKFGVPIQKAQSAVDTLFRNHALHLAKPVWKTADDPHLALLPAQSGLTGIRDEFGRPLVLLMVVVSILLLITCANVAGLLLARGTAREREMALRLALGAKRRRVIRQLLTESLLLSFAGSVAGVILAWWGAASLAAFFSQNDNGRLRLDVAPDGSVLLFAAGIAILTGIAFGLAPAFRGAGANVSAQLKGSAATLSTEHGFGRRFGLGRVLVVVQVMLSMVVIASAGLMMRTLDKLRSVDPGFDTRNILLFSLYPELAGYKEEHVSLLYESIRTRLSAVHGVKAASYSSDALLDGSLWTSGVYVDGQPTKKNVNTQMLSVGPDFFSTMKIPLLAGRRLDLADMSSSEQPALVNRAFVKRFLGDRDPIGLHFGSTGMKDQRWEIIGVVADTKYDSLRSDVAPTAYVPLREGVATFALRTSLPPADLIPTVQSVMNQIDSNLPIIQMRTQSETIDRMLFAERLITKLFALFGALGLLLAAIGVYGLLSYEVALQTREIGIRTALGAPRTGLLLFVLRRGFVLTLAGVAAGAALAALVNRLLESLLYEIRPTDPVTFAFATLILLTVGATACFLPAHRATKVDPMVALRAE